MTPAWGCRTGPTVYCPLAPDRNKLFSFSGLGQASVACCLWIWTGFFVSGLELTIVISAQGLSVVSGEGLSIVSGLSLAVIVS